MKLILGFDGGNAQDIATYGYVLMGFHKDRCYVLAEGRGKCHDKLQTNNVAEWSGLWYGLLATQAHMETLIRQGAEVDDFIIMGDSQLVIKQATGSYSVTKPHLQYYHQMVRGLLEDLKQKFEVEPQLKWTPRDNNKDADSLTNEARQRFLGKT